MMHRVEVLLQHIPISDNEQAGYLRRNGLRIPYLRKFCAKSRLGHSGRHVQRTQDATLFNTYACNKTMMDPRTCNIKRLLSGAKCARRDLSLLLPAVSLVRVRACRKSIPNVTSRLRTRCVRGNTDIAILIWSIALFCMRQGPPAREGKSTSELLAYSQRNV